MNKASKWIITLPSILILYGAGYFLFKKLATGKPILGIIPEVLLYIIPAYFVTSVLVEILVNEKPHNIVKSLTRALKLLLFFMAFAVIYVLTYRFIIIPSGLSNTFIGNNFYLFFLCLAIFLGIKFSNKQHLK